MGDSRKIGRREFTTRSALAMLAGTTITITGCGSDNPTAPTDPPPDDGPSVDVTISANHGHELDLSIDELSGGMLTLDIRGSATHPHVVTISMADLLAIAAGTRLTVDSTTDDGHSHSVSFELT